MVEKTIPAVQEETAAPVKKESTRADAYYVAPPVDIYEEKDKLVLVADLPGSDKDSVKVDVENGMLTLQASTQSQSVGSPIYREFELVNFYRQFELSEKIDVDKISAELSNGVLYLHLPKVEQVKPWQIEVKIAG
ncbi:MAG: Hsp20/alpha crystallin family protein [Candidatus Omnitrophota bacterium]|jgi:HSP20 family molecular chaperone IbpA|nr:MAG: Hsp20/alpha crystallin family protein [Candidatus Omnitrophota bacterium]